jgi:hypothetical protein
LIFLVTSLACSQLPGQIPTSTTPQHPELSETMTLPLPSESPIEVNSITQTVTSVPGSIDPTATLQSPDEFVPGPDRIEPEEITTWLYNIQSGTPVSMGNMFHPELGCSWMGVGGQVIGESGQPVGMLMVELGGSLKGENVEALTLTGSAVQWGPGGYEFQITDSPITSQGELWLRVLSLDGVPLSDKVYFDTFENCEGNAIMVNFVHYEVVIPEQIYFPLITQR